MSEALAVLKATKSVVSLLKAILDPNRRRKLEEDTIAHVLDELPRIIRLIEAMRDDLEARGCTPYEANVLAYQAVEAQKRTLDADKRRRLSNVLVNGLCAERWDKVTHHLFLRLAEQLEEEHVERLRDRVRPPEVMAVTMERERAEDARWPNEMERQKYDRRALRDDVNHALDRELVSFGLLKERRQLRSFARAAARGIYSEDEYETVTEITLLGRRFLTDLRDPPEPV